MCAIVAIVFIYLAAATDGHGQHRLDVFCICSRQHCIEAARANKHTYTYTKQQQHAFNDYDARLIVTHRIEGKSLTFSNCWTNEPCMPLKYTYTHHHIQIYASHWIEWNGIRGEKSWLPYVYRIYCARYIIIHIWAYILDKHEYRLLQHYICMVYICTVPTYSVIQKLPVYAINAVNAESQTWG